MFSKLATRLKGKGRTLLSAVLTLAGLVSLDAAAFSVSPGVGLLAIGASCFVAEWRWSE